MHFSIPDTQVFNNDNGASSYTVSLFRRNNAILLFIITVPTLDTHIVGN